MMIKKLFPIFKQRSHRSKKGTTARDFPTASVLPARGKIARSKGFTLVELLVVMGMSAIMIAVTLVSMGDARNRKAVEGEARKMAATIREVQNYTLTGKQFYVDDDLNATTPPVIVITCALGVISITSGDSTYRLSDGYRTGTSCSTGTTFRDVVGGTMPLSNGVTFSNDVDAFYFRVPRGNLMDQAGTPIAIPQLIVLQKNTASYSVCVYPSGRVEEQAGSGACP